MAAQGDGEDKKLVIQRSQLRQHGEFWHVSVSERQKLCVPFLRTVLPPEVGESARAMASTARQKRSYLHHQGEFQLQNCTVGTVHDSDHEGVVRIFVRHSYHSNELFTLYYITRHNFLYTRSVIFFFWGGGGRTPDPLEHAICFTPSSLVYYPMIALAG